MANTVSSADTRDASISPPIVEVGRLPTTATLWSRAAACAAVIVAFILLNRATYLLLDRWLLQSLGIESVFWTNMRTAIPLYIIGFAGIALGIALPAYSHHLERSVRRVFVALGVLAGLLMGLYLSQRYVEFLAFFSGEPFGKTDPVFGNDLGFYVFSLPAYWKIWNAMFLSTLCGVGFADVRGYCSRGSSQYAWICNERDPLPFSDIARTFQ